MNLSQLPLIQNANLDDKIVLVRVDHNVVKNGVINDPYRIDATLGTLYYINAKGGKIILMTHVGRPRDKNTGEIIISEKTSVQPIVDYLEKKLHIKFFVPDFSNYENNGYSGIETSINHCIKDLRKGKIDGIYLPNTRWFKGEEGKHNLKDRFASQLTGLADVFVNDAFGSWQPHASTVNVTEYLPSYAGFLMQKEIMNLEKLYKAEKPFVAVVAGAKFDTKINSLFNLLKQVDKLILGGVIYNAYLCAKYDISINGISEEDIESAKIFINKSKEYKNKIVELPFVVESETMEEKNKLRCRTVSVNNFKKGDKLNYILDIDNKSFKEENIKQVFEEAKTFFVNAVMGYSPYFNEGTIALDNIIDKNKDAIKLYGGGDTMQQLKKLLPGLYIVALDNPGYYIFTGGGAVLKAIEKNTPMGLKPVVALKLAKKYSDSK